MKGRRFVWSDPRIIELSKQFVATTDEVWRLDAQNDLDCLFFQKMADKGHCGKREHGKSRQGIYVFTADGEFLSSINNLSADLVLKTLKDGLMKWKQLSEEDRKPENVGVELEPKHRLEYFYPHDGLVFTVFSRDLKVDPSPKSQRLPFWNRDSAWFSKHETEQLVPENVSAGDTFDFPEFFVARLSKLHLVDAVKGQTEAFSNDEISGSRLHAVVVSINENKIDLKILGNTIGAHKIGRYKRGVKTRLLGTATFDASEKRFAKFEFVALGKRWGETRFNDRRKQLEPSPVGYSFEMAKPEESIIVPGIFWSYDAKWFSPR